MLSANIITTVNKEEYFNHVFVTKRLESEYIMYPTFASLIFTACDRVSLLVIVKCTKGVPQLVCNIPQIDSKHQNKLKGLYKSMF